jgi:hypothetical protein
MTLIHALLGEDTKMLTEDEDLKNYFAKQYNEENAKNEKESWDSSYRNIWLKIKDDEKILSTIDNIPHRSRIARKSSSSGVVAFAKKGSNYVFAYGDNPDNVQIVSPKVALPLFAVGATEKASETTVNFEPIYQIAKNHIFKDNTMASVGIGRKQDALNKLQFLLENYSQSRDLCLDIIRAIKDLDALPNGILKDIIDIKFNKEDMEVAYQDLKKMIPSKYLKDIFSTAERANDTGKLIVLSEELLA